MDRVWSNAGLGSGVRRQPCPALRSCHHTSSGKKSLFLPASPLPLLLGYCSHLLLALMDKSPAVPDAVRAPLRGQAPAIQLDKLGIKMSIYPCFSTEEQRPRENEAEIMSVSGQISQEKRV